MHSEDGDQDTEIASRFGIWPTLAGAALASGLIWLMFSLADGFA